MLYDKDAIYEINGSELVDSLNEAFKDYQQGEPDRAVPLVKEARFTNYDKITMTTKEAGIIFEITFNDYYAELVANMQEDKTTELILAGAIENGQFDFEDEFAKGCVKAIKEWWS